ncbi:MAG TPA: phage major capsid protein [Pseudonocardiaceae bacterium]|nr:phage major capsid protein [Pseudonocardiaceae bacterium]
MTAPAAPAEGKTPMTAEDILAALQQILDQADLTDGGQLSEDQVQRYEALEAQLAVVSKSNEVRKRHQAYKTEVTRPILPAATSTRQDKTLERAFTSYLRTGKENADLTELRAQSEGTSSQGGFLVPDGFRNQIVDRMKAFGGIANDAETITTESGNPLPWPTLDDVANVGEIVDEGGTFSSGADLVFGTASLGAYSYMAGGGSSLPLRVSLELTQDASFDIEGLVSRKLGERIARIQAQHLISGTGVKQPQGIVTGLTGIEMAANTGITYDDLITWIHSVDPAYRETGCRWAFNDKTLSVLEKLKDSNGDPIWRPFAATSTTIGDSPSSGQLLGYPVTIDQGFPDVNDSSNTVNFGVFGNLSEGYVIRRVRDVAVLVNPYSRMANRQVEYSCWARMDAVQQNTNAYVALTGQA